MLHESKHLRHQDHRVIIEGLASRFEKVRHESALGLTKIIPFLDAETQDRLFELLQLHRSRHSIRRVLSRDDRAEFVAEMGLNRNLPAFRDLVTIVQEKPACNLFNRSLAEDVLAAEAGAE